MAREIEEQRQRRLAKEKKAEVSPHFTLEHVIVNYFIPGRRQGEGEARRT